MLQTPNKDKFSHEYAQIKYFDLLCIATVTETIHAYAAKRKRLNSIDKQKHN